MFRTTRYFALIAAIVAAVFVSDFAMAAAPSAVVLMYHRFGEGKYPSTNISIDQFERHIGYLKDNRFNVVPLSEIVAALKNGTALPDKTLAITIDDAYASAHDIAWPRLKRAGFPFTLFVATEAVDRGEATIMSWDQVRAMAADGVTIGAHSHAHAHLPSLSAEAVREDLKIMNARFEAELGAVPEIFAYPFGEAGLADMDAVKAAGFAAAFGQNSGPVYGEGNLYYLPRFAMNDRFGQVERFALVVNTRPLRAVNLNPADPVLRDNPPQLLFDVAAPPDTLAGLTCFGPDGQPAPTAVDGTRVTVTPAAPFPSGRARVNCTLRAVNTWYWFGHEMIAGGISEGVPVHPRYDVKSD